MACQAHGRGRVVTPVKVPRPPVMPAPWLHVCIDMQRLFAEPGDWYAPALLDIVPKVSQLAHHAADANVFMRFITPDSPVQARGTWHGYYTHWQSVCQDVLPTGKLAIIDELANYATTQRTHDKTTFSALAPLSSGTFAGWLDASPFATLVLSGVETDVCVLATALDAIDRGYGVIIASDAVTSCSLAGHEAAMAHVYPRYDQQLRCMPVDAVIEEWPAQ